MKDDILDFLTSYTFSADHSEELLSDSLDQMKIDVRHIDKKRDGHKNVKKLPTSPVIRALGVFRSKEPSQSKIQ